MDGYTTTCSELWTVFGAEFVGMFFLILLGNGVTATCCLRGGKNSNYKSCNWLLIAFGWFAALFVAVTVGVTIYHKYVHKLTGLALNPVFSINNMILHAYKPEVGLSVVAGLMQILGQIVGAALGQLTLVAIYKKQYEATTNPSAIFATFATSPSIRSYFWNFLAEMVGTFVLVFAINSGFVLINENQTNLTFAGLLVGFVVFGIGLSIGSTTGYAINPARDLIPRLIHQVLPLKNKDSSDWKYSWVPVIGPIVGGILALLVAPGMFY